MKTFLSPVRLSALLAFAIFGTSCTTSYDAYGYPRQSVDPGVALMGVAAAGLVGYALADDNNYGSRGSCNSGYYGSGRSSYGGGYGGYSSHGGGYGGYGGNYGGGYSRGYTRCR